MGRGPLIAIAAVVVVCLPALCAAGDRADDLETRFRTLPNRARRLTGPLFWLHGTESKQRLAEYVAKVAEGGNGCFTAESRPHNDWLGPTWYRDLGICLAAAKKHDLKMWIFDERWWPSQMIGGKVPPKYATKMLAAEGVDVTGPKAFQADGYGGPRYVAALAGKLAAGGAVDGESLVDLAGHIRDGTLVWPVPAGTWKIMRFSHKQGPPLGQGRALSVDGASRDCVDWFLATVYQPHYDRFGADFGKTIPGFFYDEPETRGDWGTELNAVLAEWKVDWKKAYVAYKFRLAGDDDAAARFQYLDAFAETWGRTMYGGMARWCRKRGVKSMGHFMEHRFLYVNPMFCAGDMMRLQKYSDMGALDLVCRQMYPGRRPQSIYQTPKLASSITHVFGKDDDVTMCEIFGAYGQDITYPQMKWLTDQMQVRGVNFMVPHSFNPKSPHDRDCPPYFWNSGFEPRWPLYRVYADWTSRLSLMLSGGRHVCPVALLFNGNLRRVGKAVLPEDMTSALQDALFDCDWLPMEVFESDACSLDGREIKLHQERYRILIVPPTEAIPYGTLARARAFFEKGGVVVGYGFLPTTSATIGKTSADIAACREAIWGKAAQPGVKACRTSPAGGRSYLLPEKPAPEQLQQALTGDAGIHPTLEVVRGQTDHWLHVLHRVKDGRDVFLVCNQQHEGKTKDFRFRLAAAGVPECWDAMRNEVASVPHKRTGDAVEVDLTLAPLESVLLVFNPEKRMLPPRDPGRPIGKPIAITRRPVPPAKAPAPADEKPSKAGGLNGCAWIWYPEGDPAASAPPGARCFRKELSLPAKGKVARATFFLTADNDFVLYVNGAKAGASDGGVDNWRVLKKFDVAKRLTPGRNVLAVRAVNATDEPSPAGLIGSLVVELDGGKAIRIRTDKSWKVSKEPAAGWETPGLDDSAWVSAKECARFGQRPWGRLGSGGPGGRRTVSPVQGDPFLGRCDLPADLDTSRMRVFVETGAIGPEEAARVTVNGAYAGGFIGKPLRLDITRYVRPGANEIRIEPFAPESACVKFYARPGRR